MKHQPFETWLFEQESLSSERTKALQGHLGICDRCSAVGIALDEVEKQLEAAHLVAPATGFSNRWRIRLAEHRQKTQLRQLNTLVFSLSSGLVVLSLLLWPRFLPWIELIGLVLVAGTGKVINVLGQLNFFREILGMIADGMLAMVPMVYRVGLPVALTGLSALWIASLYRIGYRPYRKGEVR